jgi:hypothetical protein
MADTSNRTTKPTTGDRVFVADLVDRLGLAKAAQELGLSELATLGIVTGRGSYRPTIQSVQHYRSRVVAS